MMKKIMAIVIVVVAVLTVSVSAFAAEDVKVNMSDLKVTNSAGDMIGVADLESSKILVKTLQGKELTGFYDVKDVKGMEDFLKGKNQEGLRVTNSHQPKRNIVIMDYKTATVFVKLVKLANSKTGQSVEGPTYQVEPVEGMPQKVVEKLQSAGMNQPVAMIVDSGKKVQPGGWIGGFQRQFLNPVRMITGVYNDIWSVLSWNKY